MTKKSMLLNNILEIYFILKYAEYHWKEGYTQR